MSGEKVEKKKISPSLIIAVVVIIILLAALVYYATFPPKVEVVPTTIVQTALKTETLPGTTIVRTEIVTSLITTPPPSYTKTIPSTPISGGTLKVVEAYEPPGIDPATDFTAAGWAIIKNIYDTLVEFDWKEKKVVPELAESWTISQDGLRYTFKLRKNIVFSNGNPFNAEVMAYSLRRALLMKQSPVYLLGPLTPEGIKVIDEYTLELTLTTKCGAFLQLLASPVASAVDPLTVEANGGVIPGQPNEWMNSHAMGTGPFMLKEWVKGDRIVLERNPKYWGPKPYLDRVIIYYRPEPLTRVLMIKGGEVDVAQIDLDRIEDVIGTKGIVVERIGPTFGVGVIQFNTVKYPTNDTRIRKAIVHAINYDEIIRTVLKGYGIRFQGPIPKGMPGYDESIEPYQYDPELSKKFLAEAGYPEGKGLPSITFMYPLDFPGGALIAQAIQADLAKVGITLDLLGATRSTFTALTNLPLTDPKRPELRGMFWTPDYFFEDGYTFMVGSDWTIIRTGYNNTQVRQWTEAAAVELDPTKKFELYSKITKQVKEDAPYIWLVQVEAFVVRRYEVQGLYFDPVLTPGFHWQSVWLVP
jgi:peptide/nickel transport system substrate-binding protein